MGTLAAKRQPNTPATWQLSTQIALAFAAPIIYRATT
jgi:hypothetical protein